MEVTNPAPVTVLRVNVVERNALEVSRNPSPGDATLAAAK